MSTDCNGIQLTKEVIENQTRLDAMKDAFNSNKTITDMYGKVNDINENSLASKAMEEILKMQDESLVLDDAFILTDGQKRRFELQLKKHSKDMSTPLGRMEAIYKIPSAISVKTPVTKRFYQNLDRMKNFERNALLEQGNSMTAVYENIRKAFIEEGIDKGWFGQDPKFITKLKKYENKLRYSDNPEFIFEVQSKVSELIKSQDGSLIRDFNTLITLNPAEFKKAKKEGVSGIKYGKALEGDRIGKQYNPHVIEAVETARKYLNKMGKVNVQGLRALREAVWLKNTNEEYTKSKFAAITTNKTLRAFDKNIDAAIERIEKGIKEGGYYPQIMLNDAIKLKGKVNELYAQTSPGVIDAQTKIIAEDLSDMIKTNMPSNVKAQNSLLERRYSENPFFILEQYGSQAIQFNKLNTTAREYQRVMKVLSNHKIDAKYIKGLSNWAESEFTIATKGLQNRPEWLNTTIRNVRLFETVKAMGLGVTGAIRNVASAQFFFTSLGRSKLKQTTNLLKSGEIISGDSTISYKELTEAVGKIQGFTFGDIGQELYAEGILSKEGSEKLDFKYNDQTGQIEVMKSRDEGFYPMIDFLKENIPGSNLLGKAINKTPNALLFFHQKGENFTRKKMFNHAFVDALNTYKMNPEYWEKHQGNNINIKNPMSNKIVKDAANVALFAVNRFAGEYALHAKSRLLTGHPGKVDINKKLLNKLEVGATAVTSLGTGLLHYPMFFMDMQYKMLEGTVYGLMSKSFRGSPEARYLANQAAITSFIGLLSVGFNANFFNIFENDLIKKIQNLFRNIQGPDPDELNPDGSIKDNAKGYYGIASDFTGPIVDDLFFGMMAMGLINMPDSDIARMAFGYDKYLESQGADAKQRAYWNRLGTAVGFGANKLAPSFNRGTLLTDILPMIFSAYPTPETRYLNTKTKEFLGLKTKRVKGSGAYLYKKTTKPSKSNDRLKNQIKLQRLMDDLERMGN